MAAVLLVWGPSPDDPSFGGPVARYSVRRSTGPNATAEVASVAAGSAADDTFFRDEGVPPGTYFYRVNAVSESGRQSPFSNEVSVTVLPPAHAGAVAIVFLGAVPRLGSSVHAGAAVGAGVYARPLVPSSVAAHAY